MKINIISIGKFRSKDPNKDLFTEYIKRTSWKIELKELELKGTFQGQTLKEKEGELLISKIPDHSKIISLDENGKILNSLEFSSQIKKYGNQGDSNICFIIGGANGLSDMVKQKSDLILSLGKMTFPHMMVRSFLSEQLYRAYTIIANHPYHRQ